MKRHNLEVLGISDTHWTQIGQQRLASWELPLYSGHEEGTVSYAQGVALMLSKQAQNALIGWESHGSRIIKASFKTKKWGITMNVIQCYVPTNDYNEDAKHQFYNRLQSIIEKYPTKDLTILMGDLNAKVGINNTGYKDIMGLTGRKERKCNWKEIKEAITSTCHEVLGHKEHHHKEWITVDTLDKIQEKRNKKVAINTSRTRAEKAKAQAQYTEVNKKVKRSISKYVEDLVMTVEKAAREGNMRQLYDMTKKLSGNHREPERPVKSKEGKVITNIEEQRNRWVEHFKELLNRQALLNPPNIEAAPTDPAIDVGPPTVEQISMAIRQIKSGKAAGQHSSRGTESGRSGNCKNTPDSFQQHLR
ncbi:unnamed protein product [Schistosoma mattheei]|uniref:Uncharacterized protein n=1 Tax=Schistosoma mattheei TaxID=31246 RepID=A0A183Q2E1_9TREM|nr:unnamed protein product [Schistosoma mattheei]